MPQGMKEDEEQSEGGASGADGGDQNDGGLAETSSYGALQVIMISHMELLIGSSPGKKCYMARVHVCVHGCAHISESLTPVHM